MDMEAVKLQAKKEIELENFQGAVKKYKEKLKSAKWYHKIFPWKVIIIKRSQNV